MDAESRNWKVPFFSIWVGQQISYLGSMLAGFALIWWVTESTGSATTLATLTLVQILPGIVLGPFVGALVDRWNRRSVMIVADTVIALFSAWLAYLFWADVLQMFHVYAITVVRALGGTFHWPAMSASTPLMVPERQLSRVAGLNQTFGGIWNIVSPPLGALLISLLPLHGVMAIDVGTALFAIVPLFFVMIPQPKRRDGAEVGKGVMAVVRDLQEGLAYAWSWPGLLALIGMAMVINLLLNPAFSLIPILVTRQFGKGAMELSWMNSALGIGLVMGGLILSTWGGFKRRICTSMVGLTAMGVATLLIGLTPSTAFGLAVGAMGFAGLSNSMTNGPLQAIIQAVVPPEMQGRIISLITSGCAAMSPLGLLVGGRIADRFGAGTWFAIGGIACMGLGVASFFIPAIVHVEDHGKAPVEVDEVSVAAVGMVE